MYVFNDFCSNVMHPSDPQLLTWLLNRKAPKEKEESNKEEEDGPIF